MTKVYKWYTFGTLEFEFDSRKNHSNMEKHGIDFVEAQRLWQDPGRLVVPVQTTDEPRQLLVGRIDEKHWTVVFTLRGERIRIISVRRARNKEISRYEDQSENFRREV
jgi:uncharacterized DUF497 family protein